MFIFSQMLEGLDTHIITTSFPPAPKVGKEQEMVHLRYDRLIDEVANGAVVFQSECKLILATGRGIPKVTHHHSEDSICPICSRLVEVEFRSE
jgi:hypothetical protein